MMEDEAVPTNPSSQDEQQGETRVSPMISPEQEGGGGKEEPQQHQQQESSSGSGGEGQVAADTDETSASGPKPVVGRRKDGRNYVQKNSLTEAQLVAAREETRNNLKRKAKQELTEDDKKEDRRAANRLSAFQSRQRRKMIIEDLQKTVAEQSKHNADQAKEIADLKRQLQVARQENDMMRHQLANAGQAAGFAGAPLFGAAGQMPGANPLLQQLGQSQMTFQQNLQFQNAMLQNALLFSAQAQQARGNQMANNNNASATQSQTQPTNKPSKSVDTTNLPVEPNGTVEPNHQQTPLQPQEQQQQQPAMEEQGTAQMETAVMVEAPEQPQEEAIRASTEAETNTGVDVQQSVPEETTPVELAV